MVRKTREEALKTKRNIMDVAKKLFCEKGFDKTSLTDIANEAGLTRGAIYWHFSNLDELFIELWQGMTAKYNLVSFFDEKNKSTKDSVKNSIKNWIISIGEASRDYDKQCFFKIIMSVVYGDQGSQRIKQLVIDLHEADRNRLGNELKKGISNKEFPTNLDIEVVLDYIFSSVCGFALINLFNGNESFINNKEAFANAVTSEIEKFIKE